jgi:tight adherence protein B
MALGVALRPAYGFAAGGVAFVGWRGARQSATRRAALGARAELTAALSTLTAELEAGSRPPEALRAAAAVAPSCRDVFLRAAREAAEGGSAGDVLVAEARTRGLGCAWALGERTGAPLAGVLARVAADLCAEARHRRAVEVVLAGPRASAAVLTGLPLLGLALGATMGADPVHFLLATPPGTIAGCAGILLDAGGVLWMQAILRRAGAG